MKHFIWLFLGYLALVSCENNQRELNGLKKQVDSLTRAVSQKDSMIAQLNETLVKLQYPADQRMTKVQSLIDEGKYEQALGEIRSLKEIFPNSTEANSSSILIETINKKKEEFRKEEERIKALGFKAIKESSNFKIGYNTIAIGSISTGNRFTFDSYDDSWFYKDADRGTKFVSAQISVTSTDHNPKLPQFAIYKITGGKMTFVDRFMTRFARWRDYGAYLGNYHDSSNDFAKVSTVKFKIGVQVDNTILTGAYAIVVKKENKLYSYYDRYRNPPLSYEGSVDYPQTLSVGDFSNNYGLVKCFNLK